MNFYAAHLPYLLTSWLCQHLPSLSPGFSSPIRKAQAFWTFIVKQYLIPVIISVACSASFFIIFWDARKALPQVLQCINGFQSNKMLVSALVSIFFLMMPNVLFVLENIVHTELMISENWQWGVQDLLPELWLILLSSLLCKHDLGCTASHLFM